MDPIGAYFHSATLCAHVDDLHPHRVLVEVVGEVDAQSAPELDRILTAYAGGPRPVFLEMSRVDFLGVAGVSVLLHAWLRDPWFAVIAPSSCVLRLLEVVDARLPCHNSVAHALAERHHFRRETLRDP